MAKKILLDDVIETIGSSDFGNLIMHREEYPSARTMFSSLIDSSPQHVGIFYSDMHLIELAVPYEERDKQRVVDRIMWFSITVSDPMGRTNQKLKRLYSDLINNGVSARFENNDYIGRIRIAYDPDKDGLDTLKKDMNMLYAALDRCELIKGKYLK